MSNCVYIYSNNTTETLMNTPNIVFYLIIMIGHKTVSILKLGMNAQFLHVLHHIMVLRTQAVRCL